MNCLVALVLIAMAQAAPVLVPLLVVQCYVEDSEPETFCCVVMHEWQKLDAGYVALESSAKHRSTVFA